MSAMKALPWFCSCRPTVLSQGLVSRATVPCAQLQALHATSSASSRVVTASSQARRFSQPPARAVRNVRHPRFRPGATQSATNEDLFFDEERGYDKRYTTTDSVRDSGRSRLPRDLEITDPRIMLDYGGSVEGPIRTADVIRQLLPDESLRMVEAFVPPDKAKGKPAKLAVCKVFNRSEETRREMEHQKKQKEAAASERASRPKEVELTWAIGTNDVMTKMRQMESFLFKKKEVHVVIAHKKKKGKPLPRVSEPDAQSLVQRVKEEIVARGGHEAKPARGEVGSAITFFVRPK